MDGSKQPQPPLKQQHQHQHRRAKIACTHCHAKRIRCNAYQTQPCWNCQRMGASCELIVSRRGKYDRSQTKATADANKPSQIQRRSTEPIISPISSSSRVTGSIGPEYTQNAITSPPTSESDAYHGDDTNDNQNQNAAKKPEGSEMLFARLAESDTRSASPRTTSSGRTVYLGDPFSLAFVVKRVCGQAPADNTPIKMHYTIPDNIDEKAHNLFYDTRKEKEELDFLRKRGVFDMPEKCVSDKLIRVYFDCIHPAWPVFDRGKFAHLYQEKNLSPMVLQIVYFLAVTLCDESLLKEAGFNTRYKARIAFYTRAKALYHADYERSKVTLVSALFLMAFWWGGPVDEKDTWHWLGDAIGLAQTMGMHRSTALSDMDIGDRRLWKRIWWSLYIRDRHAAAALGRPVRIRDEDCDVEPLEESDFEGDCDADPTIFGKSESHHVLYAIHMAQLAVILGRILTTQYSAVKTTVPADDAKLTMWLKSWEENLPPELHYRPPERDDLGAPFWACMLHMSYTNSDILLHRPKGVLNVSAPDTERESHAITAADKTTRMVEDLLAAGTFRCAQLHLVPAIFAALTVHSVIICRADRVLRQLTENRSRQCMLGMSELSKSWPVGGWILQLFVRLMGRMTGRDFTMEMKAKSANKRKRTASTGAQIDGSRSSLTPQFFPPPFTIQGEPPGNFFAPNYDPFDVSLNHHAQHPGHFPDAQPSAEQEALWRRDQLPLEFLLPENFDFFSGNENNTSEWCSPEEISASSLNGTVAGH